MSPTEPDTSVIRAFVDQMTVGKMTRVEQGVALAIILETCDLVDIITEQIRIITELVLHEPETEE